MIGTEFDFITMFGRLATKLYENGVERELLRDIVKTSTLNKQEVEEKFDEVMKNIEDMLTNLREKKGKKKNGK
nr:MAG TPA: IHF host factor [Caudoviricetes sp.]